MKLNGTQRLIRFGAAAISIIGLQLASAAVAFACACCAESGTWYQNRAAIGSSEMHELAQLRFSEDASLFLTDAGVEGLRGIANVGEEYSVALARSGGTWRLTFTDEKGNRGTLALSLPVTMESFGVDLRDGQTTGAGGPWLYKEWRLGGAVAGTGIFKRGAAGARYKLILQGRGNMCNNAGDFKNWVVQVSGPRADFSFYGDFENLAAQALGKGSERLNAKAAASRSVRKTERTGFLLALVWFLI